MSLLEFYIKTTKSLRRPNCDQLFISWKKPHNPVGSQSISRWIRTLLEECGVLNFTGYSTRHASTSAAAQKGLSLDVIKHAAGWSGSSQMFAKFYKRPIVNPELFSSSILQT